MIGTERLNVGRGSWPTERVSAALGALGIAVGAFVVGVLGIMTLRPAVGTLGMARLDAVRMLSSHFIQVGFAVFAGAYLLRVDDLGRYVSIRRPTWADAAWIVALPVAFVAASLLVNPLLVAVGLPDPTPGAGGGVALASRPLLWPVAFVGLYLFAAPAEEAVYRGLVQGRLRGTFGTAGVVVGSALLFGLLHGLSGLLTPAVGLDGSLHWALSTVPPGVLWAVAYERTRNLLVTAVTHAMTWTVPFGALLPFALH
jgi:membrane protease YdiL (CAAX protease family)